MANRESNHPAPVAAMESDTNSGLARIIELSAQWQEPLRWAQVLKAAKGFRKFRSEAVLFSGMIRSYAERERVLRSLLLAGIPSLDDYSSAVNELAEIEHWNETLRGQCHSDAQRSNSRSEDRYQQVNDAEQELIELKNLVRKHAPQLLECAPDVDFGVDSENELDYFLDAPEVDHAPLRRDLRKLEGQVRILLPTDQEGGEEPRKSPEKIDCPFGMNIDTPSRVVKRINVGIGKVSFCTIDNDDQWKLFELMVNHDGPVADKRVHALLPRKSERDNVKSRLNQQLNKIQLTVKYEAGGSYVLKEFPG